MYQWKSKYKPGQTLYVKNDAQQLPRHCVGVSKMIQGVGYELKHPNTGIEFYYEFEVDSAESLEVKLGMN